MKKIGKQIVLRKPALLLVLFLSLLPLSLSHTAPFICAAEGEPEAWDGSQPRLYGIGSVSKVFAAAAAMKLVQEGKISLDQPVASYLPQFKMKDPRYKDITVRMLLNHSSGLMGTDFHNCFLLGTLDPHYEESFLENLKSQSLKADPGAYSVYCNDGFTLLQLLIEEVSQVSFGEFLQAEFNRPLGISSPLAPALLTGNQTLAPVYYGSRLLPFENIQSVASGGLYATAEDVCRFSQIFMDQEASLLSKESVSQMANPEYKKDAICVREEDSVFGYGLGWDSVDAFPYSQYGIQALMKSGDTKNYHTGLTVLPEQNLSVCVASSGGSSLQYQIMAQQIIMEVLKEENLLPEVEESTEAAIAAEEIPAEIKKYAGYYASGQLWKVDFTDSNTLLLASMENEDAALQEYTYSSDGTFHSTKGNYITSSGTLSYPAGGIAGSTEFGFQKESNGKTYLMGTIRQHFPGMGDSVITMPLAEKVEEISLPDSVKQTWEKRNGKKYYLIEEAFCSNQYLDAPILKVELLSSFPSYTSSTNVLKNCRIVDENHAVCQLDLPVMIGRDLKNYEFSTKNGIEYLSTGDLTLLSQDGLLPSSSLKDTISLAESCHWYSILEEDGGRELKITVPKDGAYYIYDHNDICTTSSILADQQDTVLLPENGTVLLAGSPGSTFTINR